jgi:hypothetical protein
VEVGGQTAVATASYLSDGLASLVSAVIQVCEGAPDASAVFSEEPGAYRWYFHRVGPERVRIQLREDHNESTAGKLVIDRECRLRSFAEVVRGELDRLLAVHGEEGYVELWIEHPFPRAEHARLTRLLTI